MWIGMHLIPQVSLSVSLWLFFETKAFFLNFAAEEGKITPFRLGERQNTRSFNI